jgi:thymidylate kinase
MIDTSKPRRAMLVSFSGIDGAGKSTQIANLCASLRESGLKVKLITFWDDVVLLKYIREGATHKLFHGDQGVGTTASPIRRRDKDVRSPVMTLFRVAFYFIDAISLRRIAKKAAHSEADVVIFDRYIYDELANLNLAKASTQLYVQSIMKIVPKPEIGFLLDADPVKACARKPEYPIEFLHSNRNAYLKLSQFVGGITIIPPNTISEVKAEVAQCIASGSLAGVQPDLTRPARSTST